MEKSTSVLVVNGVFKNENMLIIKNEGCEYIVRMENEITESDLDIHLDQCGIDHNDYKLTVLEKGEVL